jgi:hypothetical protein
MAAAVEDVVVEREMRRGVGMLRLPPGKANPFNDDVLVLLNTLQSYTRVL